MTRKFLLSCGIASSLLYVGMNAFVPLLYQGYSSSAMTVSELSAIGAPTRPLWVWLGVLYTIMAGAFGFGVWKSGEANKKLRIVGALLIAYAFVSLFWPLAPMHTREALAAGEKSWSDTMHLVLAFVTVLLMVTAMGYGAVALGIKFRVYSIITILTLLVFGILTGMDAPAVESNLPTPLVGVWERINIGVFLIWVVVLSVTLSKKEKLPL